MSYYDSPDIVQRLTAALKHHQLPVPTTIESDTEFFSLLKQISTIEPGTTHATINGTFAFMFEFRGHMYGAMSSKVYTENRRIEIHGSKMSDPNVDTIVVVTQWNHYSNVQRVEVSSSKAGSYEGLVGAYRIPVWHPQWQAIA